jgi:sigma-54-specific transcriptional regulator
MTGLPERYDPDIVPFAPEMLDESRFILPQKRRQRIMEDVRASCGLIVEGDPAMVRCLEEIAVLSGDTRLLITLIGEPGVGKEGFARAVHQLSGTNKRSFAAVNCSGLTDTLVESELFGHVKGAFTGAENTPGVFNRANGGTAFLDEIGDMTLRGQAALLRVMETRKFSPIGGKEEEFKGSIVTATNAHLSNNVRDGTFRKDLFGRLNDGVIRIPPFRERTLFHRQQLTKGLVERINKERRADVEMTARALKLLVVQELPGNVRQLYSLLKKAIAYVIAADQPGRKLTPKHVQRSLDSQLQENTTDTEGQSDGAVFDSRSKRLNLTLTLGDGSDQIDRAKHLITKAVRKSVGTDVGAARLLGINRNTLHKNRGKLMDEE